MTAIPPEWGRRFLPREIAKLCYEAGWTNAENLCIAVAVCLAESNGYEHRWHDNTVTDKDGKVKVVSRDRGLWMINDVSHADVSDDRAYDAIEATHIARRLYNAHGFQPWSSFGNKQYRGAHALGYAFDGISNMLRLRNGVPLPQVVHNLDKI